MHPGPGEPAAGEVAAPGARQGDLAAAQSGGADTGQLPLRRAGARTDHTAAPPHHCKLLLAGGVTVQNLSGMCTHVWCLDMRAVVLMKQLSRGVCVNR